MWTNAHARIDYEYTIYWNQRAIEQRATDNGSINVYRFLVYYTMQLFGLLQTKDRELWNIYSYSCFIFYFSSFVLSKEEQ